MARDAVLLLAFGGPTRREDVRPFLANVLRGRPVPPERVEEVVGHYEAIGGRSPLSDLTFRQAAALERALAEAGRPRAVHVGMRCWDPTIAETLGRMAAAGVRRAVGLVLSPLACEASRQRYVEAVEAARGALGARAPEVAYVPDWPTHPLFVQAMTELVGARLETLPGARLVFTAHSIPVDMAARAPYVAQLEAAAGAVAARLGRTPYTIAYQSRSGSPREPWLGPDVNEALRALAEAGVRDVAVVPIGFVADHVEVLYDLDVEASATAAAAGLRFARVPTVNDHPLFIRALAEIVGETAR